MSLGKFLGKVITAPIKIIALPARTLIDFAEDNSGSPVKAATKSIEKQIKEIVD